MFMHMLTERNETKNKPDQIRRKQMKPDETREARKQQIRKNQTNKQK